MNLQYDFSKNNEKTFIVDSIFYHSSYNPSKEAERFIQSYKFNLKDPDLIILIEPGYSYLYKSLKDKYPNSKIGIIRLIDNFEDNFHWDFEFSLDNLENRLINSFSEIELLNCEIIIWPISQKIFLESVTKVFNIIKKVVEYSKTILTTRQFFEKKWLINSIKYYTCAKKQFQIKNLSCPVVITASGPSLKDSINLIKKYRNNFFLLALSSSLSVLNYYNIVPDALMTTDGGFWALEHIKNIDKNIPIISSSESYFSKKFLQNHNFITIKYNDGFSSELSDLLNFPYLNGERNGTVSGTALKLIKALTNSPIYFCGLDLSFVKGFQHTQPNVLEINNSIKDYRLKSKENRIAIGEMNKSSLDIYKNWFSNQNDVSNVFRIIDNSENKLGKIQDINTINFNNILMNTKQINDKFFFEDCSLTKETIKQNKNLIYSFLNSKSVEDFAKSIFPGDFLAIKHNQANIIELKKQLNEKYEKLIAKIQRILLDEN